MPEHAVVRARRRPAGALLLPGLVAGALAVVPSPAGADRDRWLTEQHEFAGAVSFEPEDGGVLTVDGERGYHGRITLRPDGQLINEVAIEDYVAGVAEMPARWPMEALKAQAVAARTYAWWHAERAGDSRTDLCATTACQVYRGVGVVEDDGERWAEAVAATAGEVLMADGGPLLARYFSTSGGRTFDNAEVFPSTGEQPGLVGIDDPDDAVSPYHRWTVSFDRELFDQLLARGERLSAVVPVGEVHRRGDVDDPDATIVVTGEDGETAEVGAGELRDFLSRVAPDLRPDAYPGRADDGLRRLPSTVPTARYAVTVDDEQVVLDGRGWGHGVGMGQYGARGRAERGQDYQEILAAYYDGAAPVTTERLPETIRVDLGVSDRVTIGGDTPVTVVDEPPVRMLGTWTARASGDGWLLEPPEHTAAPLVVSSTREVERLGWSHGTAVEVEVNKPVDLHLEVRERAADGEVVLDRRVRVVDAGVHTATWRHTDPDGRPVPPGDYAVTLRATDALGSVAGEPVVVTVDDADHDAATATDGDRNQAPTVPTPVIVAMVVLPAALLLIWISSRKGRT